MVIQVEKIWLFETDISDPFYIGQKDGVTITLSGGRTISLIDIQTVLFFVDIVGQGGLTYQMRYGGEDNDMVSNWGKSISDFSLEFNMPTNDQAKLEQLIGKHFSMIGMRRDLSLFAIFGQFEIEPLKIDNEVMMRATFNSGRTNVRIFDVEALNVVEVINVIDITTVGDVVEGGFDYGFDLIFD